MQAGRDSTRDEEPREERGVRRWLFFGLGWLFFGLGALGAVVPGLPTTVFMIGALWAFSRSSERFHSWLYHHRVFGPPLQRWQRDRVIPPGVKLLAFSCMGASLLYVGLVVRPAWYVLGAMIAVITVGVVYIGRTPSRVRSSDEPSSH